MLLRRLVPCALLSLTLATAMACRVSAPQGRAESDCVEECKVKAKSRCNEDACIRGCRFVLDRLIEHEGSKVIACVATGPKDRCNDEAWATCAVHIGPHADGGPPAPAPPKEDE
ncbi:hypothetical protein LZC95_42785 [Pendulispora brunnea]|uniref:Uncharacterized protein n=1 Tax=Pendulispora brunnea TaxID=2905690 RepID=A0ABZ2K383_9BACT